MEKFILGLLLTGNELNIVYQEKINISVFIAEFFGCAIFDGFYQLVCKFVALDISYLFSGIVFTYICADSQKQMGFAKAGVTVYKQRIICCTGPFCYGDGSGVGKLV